MSISARFIGSTNSEATDQFKYRERCEIAITCGEMFITGDRHSWWTTSVREIRFNYRTITVETMNSIYEFRVSSDEFNRIFDYNPLVV